MTMTTKELLALVDRLRTDAEEVIEPRDALEQAMLFGVTKTLKLCADELAPIATALCAEVEALQTKLSEIDQAYLSEWNYGQTEKARAEAAEAEVEALRKDADRYRWLRDANITVLPYHDHGLGPEFPCGNELDAAIDAAKEPK